MEVLKEYIEKVIRNYLNEKYNANDLKTIFIKRLALIPFEEQEKLFINEMHILPPYSMSSPLFYNRMVGLNENKNFSLPLYKVKETIIKQYHFNEWQFVISTAENNVEIAILIPNTDLYVNKLEEDMETMGYFCSLKQIIQYNGLTYKAMRFEPLYQSDVRQEKIGDNILYHITPFSNIEAIKKNGLIPSSNNKYFNYPNRVYFLLSNNSIREIREIAKGFRNSSGTEDDYGLIVIDLNKVPTNVSFHDDPNLENAVYTYDKIPANAIVNIIELHVNKI